MPNLSDLERIAFLQALPKTETHLHMEGALPWDLRCRDFPEFSRKPPESWADDYRFDSFEHFLEVLVGNFKDFYTSPARYGEAARRIFAGQLAQNVRYVEFSIDAFTSEAAGISLREVARAILAAVPEGLEARLFVGFHRDGHSEGIRKTARECLDWPEVSGIDIHDLETRPIAGWLPDLYEEARKKGKLTKAHAGEFGDAEYVRDAVEHLNPDRVEHGIRAVDDAAVLQMLKERGITLDTAPISNVKLRACGDMAKHPIRRLMEAGIPCTVSTDDPMVFGNRLTDEYIALAEDLKFSLAELIQVARNGWKAALIDDAMRSRTMAELDALEQTLGPGE